MELQKLIEATLKYKIIDSPDFIDFVFANHPNVDQTRPLEELIKEVLTWGYENDELEDFFPEYLDILLQIEFTIPILNCCIDTQGHGTIFKLCKFESKNLNYYKVVAWGIFEDMWFGDDSDFYFRITEKKSTNEEMIIGDFECNCSEVFTNHGEISDSELATHGHTIKFYK